MEPLYSTPAASLSIATTGTGKAIPTGGAERIKAQAVWTAGCSAGEIVLEGAHQADYAGTWAEIDKFTFLNDGMKSYSYNESYEFCRFRVTTNVVGGTVTASINGLG